jgi:S1-C subfamily serine protease
MYSPFSTRIGSPPLSIPATHPSLTSLWGVYYLLALPLASQERLPARPTPAGPETELLLRAEQLSEVFRSAASRLKPSVVTITSSVEVATSGEEELAGDELDIPPGLEQFLPDDLRDELLRRRRTPGPLPDSLPGPGRRGDESPRSTEKMQTGIGSGVIVSPDGYLLTNNHVVSEADELQVELSDGRIFNAALIGSDKASDVAVLKIEASGLIAAALGDSTAMQVGDWVLAIGSPLWPRPNCDRRHHLCNQPPNRDHSWRVRGLPANRRCHQSRATVAGHWSAFAAK